MINHYFDLQILVEAAELDWEDEINLANAITKAANKSDLLASIVIELSDTGLTKKLKHISVSINNTALAYTTNEDGIEI